MSCWALADKSSLPAYPRLPKNCSFADAGGVSHEDVHSQRQDETECDEVNADSDSHARDYPLRPTIMRSRAPPWLRGDIQEWMEPRFVVRTVCLPDLVDGVGRIPDDLPHRRRFIATAFGYRTARCRCGATPW